MSVKGDNGEVWRESELDLGQVNEEDIKRMVWCVRVRVCVGVVSWVSELGQSLKTLGTGPKGVYPEEIPQL